MDEELFNTIFISLTQRFDLACKEASQAKDEQVKVYWLKEAAKALEARRYIVETI